jgi:hypothetical protein
MTPKKVDPLGFPIEEKLSPREELEDIVSFIMLIGIIALVLGGLYYLFSYTGKSIIAFSSIIGSILESIFGHTASIFVSAFIFLMMAGILGFGLLLKDKDDITLYKMLVLIFWGMAFITFIVLWGYSAVNPIPVSAIIGLSFIFFISPPFVYLIAKGIIRLLDDKIQQ